MNDKEYRDISYAILGCAFRVRESLGRSLREFAYQKALAYELSRAGLRFVEQAPIELVYHGVVIADTEFVDFLVEDKVPLELKALPRTLDENVRQLMTYLAFGKYEIGYVMNFGAEKLMPTKLDNFNPDNGCYRIIKPADCKIS